MTSVQPGEMFKLIRQQLHQRIALRRGLLQFGDPVLRWRVELVPDCFSDKILQASARLYPAFLQLIKLPIRQGYFGQRHARFTLKNRQTGWLAIGGRQEKF